MKGQTLGAFIKLMIFALVTVLAEHRRRGVGSALYQVVSRWAAEPA